MLSVKMHKKHESAWVDTYYTENHTEPMNHHILEVPAEEQIRTVKQMKNKFEQSHGKQGFSTPFFFFFLLISNENRKKKEVCGNTSSI